MFRLVLKKKCCHTVKKMHLFRNIHLKILGTVYVSPSFGVSVVLLCPFIFLTASIISLSDSLCIPPVHFPLHWRSLLLSRVSVQLSLTFVFWTYKWNNRRINRNINQFILFLSLYVGYFPLTSCSSSLLPSFLAVTLKLPLSTFTSVCSLSLVDLTWSDRTIPMDSDQIAQ